MIRKAKSEIYGNTPAAVKYQQRSVLPRSLSELYDQLRDFLSIRIHLTQLSGPAMHICWGNIAEIRSLAVKDGDKGKGIGISW
ncbi:MAG: hypothetical protein L7F78_12665 [Syntrophales bacterium LBB04]|nr:hypothetical protein [Syntrophales bacterium LBB04]